MKAPRSPRFEKRRAGDFAAELRTRAQAWLPAWDLPESRRDFGRALLEIAARFNSEVAERLDDVGEKMRRGFLDWLAVRGIAARPSRLPVVLKLADSAPEAVLASAPVQLQAEADGSSVMFETEEDLRIVPGRLDMIVGVDADQDAFYLAPPGLSDLKPPEPLPTQWVLKNYASVGATKLQLDPDTGLVPEMIIDAAGQQYRIIQVDNAIVTIEPALAAELSQSSMVRKVTTFAPFDGAAINRQEHALCLGHMDLLNIESAATIEVVGAMALPTGVRWQYWGKEEGIDEEGWQPLTEVPSQQLGIVVLEKKKGAIEPHLIDGKNSRWIRAYVEKVENLGRPLLQVDKLALRINCKPEASACPLNSPTPGTAPPAEAFANTRPLVLGSGFFPIGKEPRQFDAFYLGSQEAFSKVGAEIQLCFEMADPTFAALSAIGGVLSENTSVLAGVGKDRALHLYELKSSTGDLIKLRGREELQPPLPGYTGQASQGATVPLDKQPAWRLPIWVEPDTVGIAGFLSATSWGFLVAVAAGSEIWAWREAAFDQTKSGWIPFGSLPSNNSAPGSSVSGLVYLAGSSNDSSLVALRNQEMFVRERKDGATWYQKKTKDSVGDPVFLASIVPVLQKDITGKFVTSKSEGMVGIADNGKLFKVDVNGTCIPLMPSRTFKTDISPTAFTDSSHTLCVVAVDASSRKLVASNRTKEKILPLGANVAGALEAVLVGSDNDFHVVATVDDGASGRLLTWAPFANDLAAEMFESPVGASGGRVGGAPTVVDRYVVIPGQRADVLVAQFDLTQRFVIQGDVGVGIVEFASSPTFKPNDHMAAAPGKPYTITAAGITKDGETVYPIDPFPNSPVGEALYVFHSSGAGGTADISTTGKITLASPDPGIVDGMLLLIHDSMKYAVYRVSVGPQGPKVNDPPAVDILGAAYWKAMPFNGRLAPIVRLDSVNSNWDAALLRRAFLVFDSQTVRPTKQIGKAFELISGKFPSLIVLGESWIRPSLPRALPLVVDASVQPWAREFGDVTSNPELSWEYWNGKGWWKLPVELDATFNLKNSGALEFEIPHDIAATDWSGKTNFWIRARLVGGDFGQEKVTVITTASGNVSQQTIERSSEGIRAPQVVKLHIFYRICEPALPKYVLAQDSGSIRDQSDANRTTGAIVEAFVPLAIMLGRLSHDGPSSSYEDCPPDCQCHCAQGAATGTSTAATPLPTTATQPVSGRALFIGLDATLSGAQVNVLLLVAQERPHGEFAPLKIEALVADRFVPIVADDGTRAVGESGLLSMAFVVPPTRGELFGNTRTWLCLSPRAGTDTAQWKPSLRGAYLNAVWASATETLTRELVGSSDGSPNLTMRLARPPVLHGTLELRVKEPLGDEERVVLRKDDARRVLSDVQDLPGDWVLWKQVADPGDEPATERVYSFDESTGEIRFGDGRQGMIPPIGRDVIVAFRYQRTEPPKPGSDTVPGNLIVPRTALNLVSPIESVEGVFAADQAAGGAPPEPDGRVLRFGFARLRHRNRAVTPQDLEDLALESSPDIAQARCFFRPGFIRLVIVMRGKNPSPNAAQIRELHRLLTAVAPPSLSEQRALRILGPSPRRLRVGLTLRVESLDSAGALSEDVKKRLVALFDTATGGSDGDGWALGTNPSEEDIALALVDANNLESIAKVTFHEVAGNGLEQAWPATLKPSGLVVLDKDPVRIQFVTSEVMV